MTREEAIKVLRKIKEILRWGNSNLEALDMAIESLEKGGSETNFEHYFYDWTYKDGKYVVTFEEDMTHKFLNKGKSCKLKEWLLKPYEPPKYQLTRFEYDLLKCSPNGEFASIEDFCLLERMQDKGYFKDISVDVPIGDILDNCEVIE